MQIEFLYITLDSMDCAKQIAHTILTANLAACVNIIDNVSSFYKEDGHIRFSKEYIMIIKTSVHTKGDLLRMLKTIHPYDIPCIIGTKFEALDKRFYDWLLSQCN